MTEYEFLKWIGGRKFILSLVTLLMTSVLLMFGFVDDDTYQMVVLWVVSVYITGNVVQRMSN